MSITFRIATDADDAPAPVATINARQLAAFRIFLRVHGQRTDTVLLDRHADDDAYLSYRFEARVCPLALATVAQIFDFDAAVISVVEEAQFRARRIAVGRNEAAGTITMRVALISDLGPGLELDVAPSNAFALLESLALAPHSMGEITIADIRARPANPAIRRRIDA